MVFNKITQTKQRFRAMKILPKHLILFLSLLVLCQSKTYGQEGHFVSGAFFGQFTQIENLDDSYFSRNSVEAEPTYHLGGGMEYNFNFTKNLGLSSGLLYFEQGQQYKGTLTDSSFVQEYESEVELDYLKVPIMFRFNSALGDGSEDVYLSIGIGITIDFLLAANASTDPGYDRNGLTIDYRDLYKTTTSSFMTDFLFNVQLAEDWFAQAGMKIHFGLSDIENKGYDYPDNAPEEWYFPVSTKKLKKPDLEKRGEAKTKAFSIQVGISYRFSKD